MNYPSKRLLRLSKVIEQTGLSRATIYRLIARDAFPKPTHITARASRWVDQEISNWIDERMSERGV